MSSVGARDAHTLWIGPGGGGGSGRKGSVEPGPPTFRERVAGGDIWAILQVLRGHAMEETLELLTGERPNWWIIGVGIALGRMQGHLWRQMSWEERVQWAAALAPAGDETRAGYLYSGLVATGSYPGTILYLRCDPEAVAHMLRESEGTLPALDQELLAWLTGAR